MPGQSLIQEGRIGGQQLLDTAILPQYPLEEQQRLFAHCSAQLLVEPRKRLAADLDLRELPQFEPLAGEVLDQRLRSRRLEHPLDLRRQHGLAVQPVLPGQLQKFRIGHGAPEKVRQAAGQLVVVEYPHLFFRRGGLLDAEQKTRRDEHRLEADSQRFGVVSGVLFAGRFDEFHKAFEFRIIDRSAKRAGRRVLQYRPYLVGGCRHGGRQLDPGGDFFRGGQVLFQQDRRQRQDVADVVKPVPDVVRREIVRRRIVHVEKVADRVAVFRPIQTAQGRVARSRLGRTINTAKQPLDRAGQAASIRLVGLGCIGGRHFAIPDLLLDPRPHRPRAVHLLDGFITVQVHVPLADSLRMALETVLCQKRLEFLAKSLLSRERFSGFAARRCEHRCEHDRKRGR